MTDYVTSAHWNELGEIHWKNQDLLIWPGREIITYFGHVNSLGETWNFIEYRHGFEVEDITLREIQKEIKKGGVLFEVNQPTTFANSMF